MAKLNAEIKRILAKPWLWAAIVLASAAVWIIAFYWAAQPPAKLVFELWVGAEFTLSDHLSGEVESICDDYGMRECKINSYSPDDYYYAAAFALQSRSVDVYILQKDEALTTAQTGIFLPLGEEYTTGLQTLEYQSEIIGVEFTGEYYIFVNATSNKSTELLSSVVRKLALHGD